MVQLLGVAYGFVFALWCWLFYVAFAGFGFCVGCCVMVLFDGWWSCLRGLFVGWVFLGVQFVLWRYVLVRVAPVGLWVWCD